MLFWEMEIEFFFSLGNKPLGSVLERATFFGI